MHRDHSQSGFYMEAEFHIIAYCIGRKNVTWTMTR